MKKNKIKIGSKYRIFFSPGNLNNKVIHVLAIVDDDQIVYKYWLKHKNRWYYTVEDEYFLNLLIETKNMKEI
jgi:hypothetical protein